MGHQALVTLDLPSSNQTQRDIFYQVLKEEKWQKIKNLTTAWKISFKDGSTRTGALDTLKSHMRKAKSKSGVLKVEYAIQLDLNAIAIDSL